jgi:DNA mismatch repair protein MSH4
MVSRLLVLSLFLQASWKTLRPSHTSSNNTSWRRRERRRLKRRKLILNLKEHLMQAHTGVLEGEVLSAWLQELQKEFINRMTALEVEAASPEHVTEYGESNDGDVEMLYRSGNDGEDRPSTHASQASIVSISSRATSSTISSSPQRSMSEASTIRAVSDNER